jgi:hypothetical protein
MNNIIAASANEYGQKYAVVLSAPMYIQGRGNALAYPFLGVMSSLSCDGGHREEEQLLYSPGIALNYGTNETIPRNSFHYHADNKGASSWIDYSSGYLDTFSLMAIDNWFCQLSHCLNDQRVYSQSTTMFRGQLFETILNDMQLTVNPGDVIDKVHISDTMYSFLWAGKAASDLVIMLKKQLEFLDGHYRQAAFEQEWNENNEPSAKSVPPTKRKVKPKLRRQILERDNYQCLDCGRSPRNDAACVLHVDHRIPLAKGGTNDPDNLQTLCDDCNIGKGVDLDWKLKRSATVQLAAV